MIPRNAGQLLFAGLPWAAGAQQEHDIFTQALRDRDVQVLYLTELLQDVLEYAPARQRAITAALGSVYQLLGASDFEQWDAAANLLVLAPGAVVSHERNVATTHARLERSGVQGDHRAGQRAVRRPGRAAQPVLPGEQGSGAAPGRLIQEALRMRSA